jgi:hypothetical protein
MSSISDSTSEEEALKKERLESYKKVWRWFLWLGWPAAIFVLWLGGRIINGMHARIMTLEAQNTTLKEKTTP